MIKLQQTELDRELRLAAAFLTDDSFVGSLFELGVVPVPMQQVQQAVSLLTSDSDEETVSLHK